MGSSGWQSLRIRSRLRYPAAAIDCRDDSLSKDPLHGITLEKLLTELVALHGWDGLAQRVDVRCFKNDPSIKSSLAFLRKTPWARQKVEELYLRSRAAD